MCSKASPPANEVHHKGTTMNAQPTDKAEGEGASPSKEASAGEGVTSPSVASKSEPSSSPSPSKEESSPTDTVSSESGLVDILPDKEDSNTSARSDQLTDSVISSASPKPSQDGSLPPKKPKKDRSKLRKGKWTVSRTRVRVNRDLKHA